MFPAPVLYPTLPSAYSAVPPSPSAYPHIIEPAARSVKRERSTRTNRPIFRASAFAPHDGDGDQCRRPQLEHEPAGLISVFLAISRALSVGMHGRFASRLTPPSPSCPCRLYPGYNHCDKINSLNVVLGYATGQCMLAYIHVIEVMSQPEYGDLIPMFGIVNEVCLASIERDVLTSFIDTTTQLPRMIRGITGNGPFINIHDDGLPPGSDRIIFDTHPYFPFDGAPNDSPITMSTVPLEAAGIWPPKQRLLGIARREHMERVGVKQFAFAPMDTTRDWFFLVKIGPAQDGRMPSPLWSYQFGPQTGFMPTDPRHSVGICAALGIVKDPFTDVFSACRMVSGRPRGPGDAAADAHRGSEHCVPDVYDPRRGLHVPRYVESDWFAGSGGTPRAPEYSVVRLSASNPPDCEARTLVLEWGLDISRLPRKPRWGGPSLWHALLGAKTSNWRAPNKGLALRCLATAHQLEQGGIGCFPNTTARGSPDVDATEAYDFSRAVTSLYIV
ncbi:hypothetical protein DFH08DRAFT_957693 [Mycena albidolilacea]|uniref:Uncharacterized protein n=1 Tax=Mycena albidolilacea TaxID=1033008 RepID=A0AAD7A8I1_9AGAR|nr:hypothetical protein DFH08DRAFT_957693 [Mycena albidolilacea]